MPAKRSRKVDLEDHTSSDEDSSSSFDHDEDLKVGGTRCRGGRKWACRCCICCIGCSVAIPLLLVTTVVLVLHYIDPVAKEAIQAGGYKILGVPVHVDSVDVQLFSEAASVKDLRVETWPGYGTKDLLQVGHAALNVNLWSLLGQPHSIRDVTVRDVHVRIHQMTTTPGMSSNVNEIVKHLVDVMPKNPTKKTYIVDKVQFSNITVKVCVHPLCDALAPTTFNLKDVQVLDIGRAKGGVTLREVVATVTQAMMIEVLREAPTTLVDDLSASMGAGLREFGALIDFPTMKVGPEGALVGTGEFGKWFNYTVQSAEGRYNYTVQIAEGAIGEATDATSEMLSDAAALLNSTGAAADTWANWAGSFLTDANGTSWNFFSPGVQSAPLPGVEPAPTPLPPILPFWKSWYS